MKRRRGAGRGKRRPKPAETSPAPPARWPAAADSCLHHRLHRLGIQEVGVWPYRVHLVVCVDCGTTLTTESLRSQRRAERKRAGGK